MNPLPDEQFFPFILPARRGFRILARPVVLQLCPLEFFTAPGPGPAPHGPSRLRVPGARNEPMGHRRLGRKENIPAPDRTRLVARR